MRKIILLALLGFLAAVQGHLTRPGRWQMRGVSSPRVYHLTPQNNALLREQEDDSHGGYQFAHPVPFPIRSTEQGFWDILPGEGGKLWSFTITSEGALNLGLTFEDFYLPEGSELHISGEKETRGAFTASNNPVDGHFTLFPFEGSSLTVEYFQPHWVDEEASLKVAYVAHGYKTLGYGDSGSCNINVACDSGKWSNQIRSSGMLLSSFGSRFCSGALVNNLENDGTQYFLTAAHCSVGTSDQIMFNYQSATCANQDGPTNNIVGKLVRLASNTYSDFTLLRIDEPIPSSWNVYLSGVSGENVAPQSMTGIHHPSGDIKKISHANKAGTPDKWSAAEPGNWHWRVSFWDEGTTEPGSSGSPLYDQNQRVVGQLHGGAASCRNIAYDSYGACWASWSNGLGTYLDPKGTGKLLIDGANLNALRGY